ncbi:MAG TPA: hypothetical protein VJ697_06200 [Nitrososphaeraceae archaeon]|nr:hypothetical protein [Nitrososphaeraceae archaeon]
MGLARRLLFNPLLHEILIQSYVQPLCYIGSQEFPMHLVGDTTGISFLTESPFALSFYLLYGLFVVDCL